MTVKVWGPATSDRPRSQVSLLEAIFSGVCEGLRGVPGNVQGFRLQHEKDGGRQQALLNGRHRLFILTKVRQSLYLPRLV